MDQNAAMEEGNVFKNGLELVKSVTDKHIDLLRPSSRLFSMFKGDMLMAGYTSKNNDREKGKYTPINDNGFQQGLYDKPLPCFGCGIGWFSFLIGFGFPLMWYYATFLYLGSYYRKDPRERAGLAASAIAVSSASPHSFQEKKTKKWFGDCLDQAMGFSVILFIVAAILLF
ncbi:hypothetical protein M8C21_002685 [Ambrosia artemisiifolia]|uniref:Uncharacterized protein n=1 Tax=Ambrosia artemisiifolia TaxID=4212 RepID=A0AAD5BLF3_AMBAR|nr:hypothetical protein M8C21_002685 [Ambrosia artemisiifolia]